tara:strand:+ start:3826 stop:4620 length:795 start_codon:yes stop_codon:yes gene_type:complete
MDKIYKLYAHLFGRVIFIKLNRFLYHLSLRGLGILNYQNEYLTGEKTWLKKYLKDKKNPLIIDVGANVGNYSKMILSVNQGVKILAFEPHPITFKKLISNINSANFQAFNFGASHSKGNLKLYDYESNDGSQHASIFVNVIKDLHKKQVISHEVEIISLDDFLTKKNIFEVDLLKIDTEGNEYNVLVGLKSFIAERKIKAIHFEFNEMNIISKSTFKDFWDFLSGYNFYRLLPGGKLLPIKDYSPILTEIYAFQNIIAILEKDK